MSSTPNDSPLIRALVERLLPAVDEARDHAIPPGLQLMLTSAADFVRASIEAERVRLLAAQPPRRPLQIAADTYFHDYPSEKVGGGNPYNCCSYCKRTDPEINGTISGHRPDCIYRQRKEMDLRGELWMPMRDAMEKARDMQLQVRFEPGEVSTVDGWFVPLKDGKAVEAAFVELVATVEERL